MAIDRCDIRTGLPVVEMVDVPVPSPQAQEIADDLTEAFRDYARVVMPRSETMVRISIVAAEAVVAQRVRSSQRSIVIGYLLGLLTSAVVWALAEVL